MYKEIKVYFFGFSFFLDTIKLYTTRVVIKIHYISVNCMNKILSYYYSLFPKVNFN